MPNQCFGQESVILVNYQQETLKVDISDSRGHCRFDKPVTSCEKREEECDRDAVMRASLILVSSFLATISAAFPRGARMNGTCPNEMSDFDNK